MAPIGMSYKEMEASLSLLDMMAAPQPSSAPGDRLHDSLMRAVATEAATETETAEQLEQRRHAHLSSLSRELTLEELRAHFDKPIVQVAKEFGICTTFLKKICRRCGIKRWPHRQIRSLARTIHMLRQLETQAETPQDRAKYAAQIAQMEAKQRAVFENPDGIAKIKRVKKLALSPGGKSASSSSSSGASEHQDDDLADDTSSGSNQCSVLMAAATVITASAGYNADAEMRGQAEDAKPLAPLDVVIPPRADSEVGPFTTPVHASGPPPVTLASPSSVAISPSNRKRTILGKSDPGAEQRLRSASIGSLHGEGEEQQELVAV